MFLAKLIRLLLIPFTGFLILNPLPTPKPAPTIAPSPTPKPLTFAELNKLYGPCVNLPVLMYHHVQENKIALSGGYKNLNVDPANFQLQMQYLKTRQYSVISMADLNSFFIQQTPLPAKPLLLTFDDGYTDFYTQAFPILQQFNYPATLFLPTGLVNNPGYLNWSQIAEMTNHRILFANHTWSHYRLSGNSVTDNKELTVADTQLNEHHLNSPKVFAYPYGTTSSIAQKTLADLHYQLGFTTRTGRTLCARQKFLLPRLRIGNTPYLNL